MNIRKVFINLFQGLESNEMIIGVKNARETPF